MKALFILLFVSSSARYAEWETIQPYCEIAPIKCIEGRHDDAFMPYYDSKCYCDSFCFRSPQDHDCCPDYDSICLLTPRTNQPTVQQNQTGCVYANEQSIDHGDTVLSDCNSCRCEVNPSGTSFLDCELDKCANDPTLIQIINQDGSWAARSYDRWRNRKLKDLKTLTLGTIMRNEEKRRMNFYTVAEPDERIYDFNPPKEWTAQDAGWLIGEVKDQADCGVSWALSAVDVAADRLTRDSESRKHIDLSIQFVLACTHRTAKEGCRAGRIDHAWGFLKDVGTVSEQCYPYISGSTKSIGTCDANDDLQQIKPEEPLSNITICPTNNLETNRHLYKFSPAYRVADQPNLIKYELYYHGPVQATILVCPDFYQYSTGVYRRIYTGDMDLCDYHSIRLIGWGQDHHTGTEYWKCINSWGREWGEDGTFKIAQGDSNINDFIIASWGRKIPIL